MVKRKENIRKTNTCRLHRKLKIVMNSCVTEGRRVWRYQRGNQNPYIEEEQTTQWEKEKVQKDK